MAEKIKIVLENPQEKKTYNEQLFTIVAPRYDFITRVLSFGQDRRWKTTLIKSLPDIAKPYCVDLACGTGDVTFALAQKYHHGVVVGVDLTLSMLDVARAKNRLQHVSFVQADMNELPYQNDSIDIITGSYALRNAPDLDQALAEVARVLKTGGTAAFLDFSKPKNRLLQKGEYYLLKWWGSLWGFLVHRDPRVYAYIAESLALYPNRSELRLLLEKHGFDVEKSTLLMGGCLELLVCKKRK
jgi:ubiquinone/menaquinone biosynthesis methyltransferase